MIDISRLPESPGVYLFKDKDGRILYVGKAKNIKERVKTYFRNDFKNPKTQNLIKKIFDLEAIITSSEKEAFLLENNLIKEYAPPYNVNLRDDKTYISIKITTAEEYPGLYITRNVKDDGSTYFGPYPHAHDVKETLRLLQRIYPLRRCKNTVFRKRSRPCILNEIGRCLAPCTGQVTKEEYAKVVGAVIDFLSGRADELLKDLEQKIQNYAKTWQFEEAQALKEKYMAIREMLEKQNVHSHFGKDRDVWAFLWGSDIFRCVVLNFRRGVLIGKKIYKKTVFCPYDDDEIVSLLFQYYSFKPIPDEIILSEKVEGVHLLREYLSERAKKDVSFKVPSDDETRDLAFMAIENLYADDMPLDVAFVKYLHLSRKPRRIEIYDCSHLFGTSPYAAMVVFEDFKMKKEDYRLFRIKDANPMDDLASLKEVLTRRIKDSSLGPLPDLFIVDGGRAHLNALSKVLSELKIEADLIGIAKARKRKKLEDTIYLPTRKNPLYLPRSSSVFKELIRMRDEAHRFALSSHKRGKKKDAFGA
ncbi:MAG: excinuclease ABC subunit UvrC [Desulfobacterota bacterium]|nr:excinuclease ABC subunit UvrC [Thermodesulfobacteriota bacterium]MDW8001664.1 excinuclease ABC subunit UvrC [Deltaproteobacteria bacterium]